MTISPTTRIIVLIALAVLLGLGGLLLLDLGHKNAATKTPVAHHSATTHVASHTSSSTTRPAVSAHHGAVIAGLSSTTLPSTAGARTPPPQDRRRCALRSWRRKRGGRRVAGPSRRARRPRRLRRSQRAWRKDSRGRRTQLSRRIRPVSSDREPPRCCRHTPRRCSGERRRRPGRHRRSSLTDALVREAVRDGKWVARIRCFDGRRGNDRGGQVAGAKASSPPRPLAFRTAQTRSGSCRRRPSRFSISAVSSRSTRSRRRSLGSRD